MSYRDLSRKDLGKGGGKMGWTEKMEPEGGQMQVQIIWHESGTGHLCLCLPGEYAFDPLTPHLVLPWQAT